MAAPLPGWAKAPGLQAPVPTCLRDEAEATLYLLDSRAICLHLEVRLPEICDLPSHHQFSVQCNNKGRRRSVCFPGQDRLGGKDGGGRGQSWRPAEWVAWGLYISWSGFVEGVELPR